LAVELTLDPAVPVIGISGTNGKSTVTHVTGQLLEAAGLSPFVGGNLGDPVSNADRARHGAYVLELSSYQLENAGELRADVGLLLNLTPDHLARHGDMAGYADAKCRLFANARPDDVAVIPAEDPWLTHARAGSRGIRAWLNGTPGVQRRDSLVSVALGGHSHRFDLSGLPLPGTHNQDNVAAALFAAWVLVTRAGADVAALQDAIPHLTGLPHRMQVVPTSDGRTWIDDSKSTNLASTLAAVKGLSDPTVLLLGGQWKGGGFDALVPHLSGVHTVITFGGNGPDIASELVAAGLSPVQTGSLEDAVKAARSHGRPGDVVLLSPGCASFDAFDDFTHRGRVFQDLAQHPS
jgi:UDP-N-acetylmuramoylalanine--D-glutamate ligase